MLGKQTYKNKNNTIKTQEYNDKTKKIKEKT